MKMHELLDSPEKWTQGASSRNKDGTPDLTQPVCWCIIGASDYCYPYNQAIYVRQKIRRQVGKNIAIWNDDPDRTFEEVYNLLKELDV